MGAFGKSDSVGGLQGADNAYLSPETSSELRTLHLHHKNQVKVKWY
jgi:hypothetical protein